jgi:hypothetical protein
VQHDLEASITAISGEEPQYSDCQHITASCNILTPNVTVLIKMTSTTPLFLKGCLLPFKTRPFTQQKVTFCNVKGNLLVYYPILTITACRNNGIQKICNLQLEQA